MTPPFQGPRARSGQILLIGVLIFVVLLISVPIVIFVNNILSRHGTQAQQKLKGRAIAEEGVAYAIQQLSSSTIVANPPQSTGDASPGGPISDDNAEFVSQDAPAFMTPSQQVGVSVTLRNTGASGWTSTGSYKLGSRNPQNNTVWIPSVNRVLLPVGEVISPGQIKTFYFTVTAPAGVGDYDFQWGMVQDGQYTPNLTLSVRAPAALPPNWPYPPNGGGGMPPAAPSVRSAHGASFSIAYTSTSLASPVPDLQSYQVGIMSRPLDPLGRVIPGSSLFALVSPRSVGLKMPAGLSAAAALELGRAPAVDSASQLRVEFGPIVVRDDATWTLDPYNASMTKRPRKFSAGGIAGRTVNPSAPTDQKEYWAYASLGAASVIDARRYIELAKNTTCNPPSACLGGADCTPEPSGRCYFPNVGGGTIVFDDFSWVTPGADRHVYINGNARFTGSGGFNINLASGAFIVTGNLTLGNNGQPAAAGTVINLRVPPTVGLEDPYCTCGEPACIGVPSRHQDFQGFLYVKGDLRLNAAVGPPSTPNNWTMIGAVRVDGGLTLDPGTSLWVYYNDVINHVIRTSSFELQIDSVKAVQ